MESSALVSPAAAQPDSRARRLMAATAPAHERLDAAVMACEPFASRERYARFLTFQHRFHAAVDMLYRDGKLAALVPDLASRRRLPLIEEDIRDVIGAASADGPPDAHAPIGPVEGLGWLFVAEGSTLGAAGLLKRAQALGFSETHGARHLAGHPDGRGLHWRGFTAALDRIALSPADETQVVGGANAAFRLAQDLVTVAFAR